MFNSGDVLLSHTLARAVPSGLQGLTAVFGMGTGGTPALQSPKSRDDEKILNIDGQQQVSKSLVTSELICIYSTFYGQAERAISNGQLNVLLRLHIRPIDVVVFHGPS